LISIPLGRFVAIAIAVVQDLRQRQPRDFWHWLGVAALFGVPLHLAALAIAAPNF
jgi:hypothetical protein